MLSTCMLTPLKLARLMEWKGRLGKSSALLSIDVTNQQIGLALAYYRQQAPAQETNSHSSDDAEDNGNANSSVSNSAATTLLTPLPPIPYMSNKPYHPSYAFLHRPEIDTKTAATNSLRRKERTLEIANQLAHLAKQREVNGILIRWPGDMGGFVCGASSKGEVSKNREEDQLMLSLEDDGRSSSSNIAPADNTVHEHGDGSMGYLRGRILHVLDSCCSSHGHNETKVSSEPLLMEGVRPFALWDTSSTEQEWVLNPQQHNSAFTSYMNRVDKYGNSFTETDAFGRSAVFGNRPPKPTQGQFRYSSKQLHHGYRVSSEFGSLKTASSEKPSRRLHRDNFDSFQDSESYLKQFEGSLAAMHALYEFAGVHLPGRITLPSWISTSPETNNCDNQSGMAMRGNESLSEETSTVHNGYRRSAGSKHAAISKTDSSAPRKVSLVALAQMPVRRRRRGADRRS